MIDEQRGAGKSPFRRQIREVVQDRRLRRGMKATEIARELETMFVGKDLPSLRTIQLWTEGMERDASLQWSLVDSNAETGAVIDESL